MSELMKARTSFTPNGTRVIQVGTVLAADDPVVRQFPAAFVPFEPERTRTTADFNPAVAPGTAPKSVVPDRPKGNAGARAWAEYVHSFEPEGASVEELEAVGRDTLKERAADLEAALKES